MPRFNLALMFADVVYCNDIFLNVNSQHVIQDKTNESFYQVWYFGTGMVFLKNPKCVLDDAVTICQPNTFIGLVLAVN